MRVKLKTTMAGPQGTFAAGAVVDLEDAQARDLITGGYAVPVQTGKVETATVEKREKAVNRRGKAAEGSDNENA